VPQPAISFQAGQKRIKPFNTLEEVI